MFQQKRYSSHLLMPTLRLVKLGLSALIHSMYTRNTSEIFQPSARTYLKIGFSNRKTDFIKPKGFSEAIPPKATVGLNLSKVSLPALPLSMQVEHSNCTSFPVTPRPWGLFFRHNSNRSAKRTVVCCLPALTGLPNTT